MLIQNGVKPIPALIRPHARLRALFIQNGVKHWFVTCSKGGMLPDDFMEWNRDLPVSDGKEVQMKGKMENRGFLGLLFFLIS